MPVTPDFAVVNCEPTVIAFIFASFRPKGTDLIFINYLLMGQLSQKREGKSIPFW
jgi:hypothetical protein